MTHIKCICCKSKTTVNVGTIIPSIHFAKRLLSKPIEGGALIRCKTCGLAFRYPRLNKDEIDDLYLQGESENWHAPLDVRYEWQIANQWIPQFLTINDDVLDVGCFDGGFLKTVGSSYHRYGVEIHEVAGLKARKNGIKLIGQDFNDLKNIGAVFDAVTSFDVIEHTYNPYTFLSDLVRLTRKNGIIIVSSGNSDAFSWRLMGSNYYYCSIGEHLSFINPRWCEWAALRLGIELKKVIPFSHIEANWRKRLSDIMKNLIFKVSPKGFSFLRSVGLGGEEYRQHKEMLRKAPFWMSAKDHFICLFLKK
jgi:SAM-dependent methyltransferase